MKTLPLLALVLTLPGCGVSQTYTAKTTATYNLATNELHYESSKDQENFKATLTLDDAGKLKTLQVETTATTPAGATAAAQANVGKLTDLLGAALQTTKQVGTTAAKLP